MKARIYKKNNVILCVRITTTSGSNRSNQREDKFSENINFPNCTRKKLSERASVSEWDTAYAYADRDGFTQG